MKSVILVSRRPVQNAFSHFKAMSLFESHATEFKNMAFGGLADLGVKLKPASAPVPLFGDAAPLVSMKAFATEAAAGRPQPAEVDFPATEIALAAEIPDGREPDLVKLGYEVWPDEPMALMAPGVDCRPFAPPVDIARIRAELGVGAAFAGGHKGGNSIVAVIDEGVNQHYPVIGGTKLPQLPRPGSAPITSHGSMCAADILVAAPEARLLDYPLLTPTTFDQMALLQEILDERKQTGRPHVANNSYGFYKLTNDPKHPGRDAHHPFNRKVRELVSAGITCFFAAGNCGPECPAGRCDVSAIGPRKSINGANSLPEVLTVAAVNAARVRIGYSSVGPGLLFDQKPDFASYSHFYGNFGPGRPGGGGAGNYDNGTSAATPVAAGVAALLWSRRPTLDPAQMRQLLLQGLIDRPVGGHDYHLGGGVIHAGNSFALL